ncbi:hypothetical protein [Pseudalkalibacillus hwajinpoensis]|uniref:hypothetical protein n=1 Tax=Guptibacillus hwajinpoensis TaxID=208199 RepID=UPI001CFD1E13|nr:hypothetical protein [Pseudalkalibacillus hwajinpoensis]
MKPKRCDDMGCCHSKNKTTLEEEEERINEKGKEQLPLFGKVILSVLFLCGIALITYL